MRSAKAMGLVAIFVISLVLVAPAVGAAWKAAGGVEPGTLYDTSSRMWAQPDTGDGAPRIYFQAFQSVDQVTLNPNVAALETRLLPPGAVHHRALLGHWKDCNQDGYVGHAESALQDYASILLLDDHVCPPSGPYNDGEWVSEMIGIGMVDPCEQPGNADDPRCAGVAAIHINERVFYAPGTMVWADVGAPGSLPSSECPIAPLPPGTTSGTGALLGYADCQDGRRVAEAINTVDEDSALGLRFDDPDHPEHATSALNVLFPVTLFGGPQGAGLLEAGSDAPAARVWDCSAPREITVGDPTGTGDPILSDPTGGRLTGPQPALPVLGVVTLFVDEDGDPGTPGTLRIPLTDGNGAILWAPRPSPSLDAPTRSWWDAAELALDGPRGDCNEGTTSPIRPAAPGAIVEGGDAQVASGGKDRASFAFTFYDGHRGINGNIDSILGPTAPSDAGLLYMRHGRGGTGPLWSAEFASENDPQLVTRGSLEPSRPLYWTYYAKIGTAAFAEGMLAPGGSVGVAYGSAACGGFTSGVHNGWVCDPALWWRDALGRDARPRYLQGEPFGPVPGEIYHLRDVDCYDGHVGVGLYASGTQLTAVHCE